MSHFGALATVTRPQSDRLVANFLRGRPQTRDALVAQTADISAPLGRTLSWDQDRELILHEKIARH